MAAGRAGRRPPRPAAMGHRRRRRRPRPAARRRQRHRRRRTPPAAPAGRCRRAHGEPGAPAARPRIGVPGADPMTAEGMQRSGAGTVARRRPMSLWRLERLRLLRSRRLVVLLGVFTFFGLTGPMLARYMGELLERFGGGVTVTVPEPVPADGITQYLANSSQIGVLVVLVVAAGALAFDATPELAAFLRARTPVRRLLMPRYVLSVLAAGTAFTVGMLAAWYETQVLLGGLPVGAMLVGIGLSWLYLAFAVAVVAGASASRFGGGCRAIWSALPTPCCAARPPPTTPWPRWQRPRPPWACCSPPSACCAGASCSASLGR